MADTHQRRLDIINNTVEFLGTIGGMPYAIRVEVKKRIVTWLEGDVGTLMQYEAPKVPLQTVAEKKQGWQAKDEPDCPGCSNWFKKLASGAKGFLKVSLGVDSVTDEVYKQRKKICLQCEHYNGFGLCNHCGCILDFKTRIKSENCPILKWTASK